MQYRSDRNGDPISILGFGCMRFSKKGNNIDIDKAEKEIKIALDGGVNYFDTAYVYPGSEVAVGEIFERLGCREKIRIATKLPHYLVRSLDGAKKTFEEELKRLRTGYVDQYLMHMLDDIDAWEKLKKMGVDTWLEEEKKNGRIRNIGFSYHGNTDNFIKLLDAYNWDFCQIQYNYLDEHTQAGKRGLEYAYEKGIPVVIMEPLRGGRLVNLLPEKAKKLIAENERGYSPAEWGLRWLYNQPGVTCVLSGMNSEEMVRENVRIASESEAGQFTDEDFELIRQVKEAIGETMKVGCTGCSYCMPCPFGVDIPLTFHCYNAIYSENRAQARHEYLQATLFRKTPTDASACKKCGRCEQHCPQHIAIREELVNARKELETPYFKPLRFLVGKLHLWG
ncbi:MAG: aldo/keto reductase [Lachnospiraceae bacterium]|nr:aldo/keto reductase [Lachnospiraceae bacterium]